MERLQDPIDFILEEHDRQFRICALFENLISASESEPSARWATSLLDFLTKDLPIHIEDEEQDLFPILVSRQGHNQDLPVILDQLVSEHELDLGLVEAIVEDLRHIAEGRVLNDSTRFCMYVRTFTEAMRRHLNWENRVVLPLARRVLSEEDRAHLGGRIAERHRNHSPGGS